MTILADTGALYALIDRDDAWHLRVRGWWKRVTDEIRVPVAVLPELTYLLQRRIGAHAELEFTRALANGEFTVEPLLDEDINRAADIMAIYADTPIGFVDATFAATAERLGIVSLLTTDRRHFLLIRPQHASAFRLLP
ncbi:MAG: type II toxin-antitoxin system VapC family toxin [Gemmatimonadaceae bacterium]